MNWPQTERDRDQSSEVRDRRSISHRHTRTDTDICPADFAGQKESSLRETDSIVAEIINKCWNAWIKTNLGIQEFRNSGIRRRKSEVGKGQMSEIRSQRSGT